MFPILFQIGETVVPTYLVWMSLILCCVLFWASRRADSHNLPKTTALDFTLLIALTGFIGARLFHVFFEYPEVYVIDPTRIIYIWEGGFVFYGGFILATLTGLAFIEIKRLPIFIWLDFLSPLIAFAYGAGRLGCFFAGCCYGRACQLPWAVHFPQGIEAPAGVPLHPTQIYASFWDLSLLVLVLLLERKRKSLKPSVLTEAGSLFFVWMIGHGIGRIVMEYFRDDYRGVDVLGMSPSTFISFFVILFGLGFLFRKYLQAPTS